MQRRRSARDARGAVTAELALGLPLLLAVTVGLVWLLAVGLAQLRVVDAARETARGLARGDDRTVAMSRGQAIAPSGASFAIDTSADRVVVRVSSAVRGPGGLFRFVPGVRVESAAVAARESPP